jgi:hypothetical protein
MIAKEEYTDNELIIKFTIICKWLDVFIFYIKPNNLNYNNILLEINEIKNTKKINDYSNFDSKKITTIIFSLDNDEYYPLSRYDKSNNKNNIFPV